MYFDDKGAEILFFIVVIGLLLCFVLWLLGVIGRWKMFQKANQPGWQAIIPIYDQYIQCKIVGINPWWILIALFGGYLLQVIPIIGQMLAFAISIYYGIILSVSTANSYGKTSGWAIGLFFLEPFFLLALGLGKSEYKGPTPVNDPILGSKEMETPVQTNNKYCPNCGERLDIDINYCTNCGNKL